jgi:hypothetical protein
MMTMATTPTRMPSLYDDNGYQQEYSGPDYGGNDNNDNDDRQPTPPPPPPPPPAPAPITYDPYEDASLYGDGGYQQEYSGSNYGGSSNNSVTRGLGTSTTLGEDNPQLAYADPNSRYDFDYSAAYDTEIIPEKLERCQRKK